MNPDRSLALRFRHNNSIGKLCLDKQISTVARPCPSWKYTMKLDFAD